MSAVLPAITGFMQKCYEIALNSFMSPRGSTTQQLAAWDTISFIVCCYYVMSIIVIIAALGLGHQAQYGRFSSIKSSLKIPARMAWFLQELPSFLIASYFFIKSFNESFEAIPIPNRLLLLFFIIHYTNRTFIYPYNIRGGKPTPFLEFIFAVIFTAINGFLQSLCLTQFNEYKITKIYEFNVLFGIFLFISGFIINLHSDSILRNLRKPNETGYKIPYGGMYEYVTSANYFGEFVEWIGFAIAANNGGGYAFAIFTFSNLFPRAVETHKWYQKKFDNYPKNRKVFIPFIL